MNRNCSIVISEKVDTIFLYWALGHVPNRACACIPIWQFLVAYISSGQWYTANEHHTFLCFSHSRLSWLNVSLYYLCIEISAGCREHVRRAPPSGKSWRRHCYLWQLCLSVRRGTLHNEVMCLDP